MITNEKTVDQLAMVSRLLAYQREKGESTASAIKALNAKLPEHYGPSIHTVEGLLKGDDVVLTGYSAGPFELLSKLITIVRKENGDVGQLFVSTQETLRDAMVRAREYWSGFNALISYLVFVFSLAIVVISLFTIKVLPQFSDTFFNMGHELPEFTQLILANDVIFGLIVAFFIVCVLLSVACSYHIKKRVASGHKDVITEFLKTMLDEFSLLPLITLQHRCHLITETCSQRIFQLIDFNTEFESTNVFIVVKYRLSNPENGTVFADIKP